MKKTAVTLSIVVLMMILWLSASRLSILKQDKTNVLTSTTETISHKLPESQNIREEKINNLKNEISYDKETYGSFYLSPDGKYIAYEKLEGFTSCCGSETRDIPLYELYIIDILGENNVHVQDPYPDEIVGRNIIKYGTWYPDSSGILVYFQYPDEATSGSAIYKVGHDGKSTKDTLRKSENYGCPICDMPVFSPDGKKFAYIKDMGEIWLGSLDGSKHKMLVTGQVFFPPENILKWSSDGSTLQINLNKKEYLFDGNGNAINKQ